MSKFNYAIVYIYVKDADYTEDFKKIVKLMKNAIVKSTIIIRKRDNDGKSIDILVDDKFIRIS